MELSHLEQAVGSSACNTTLSHHHDWKSRPENTHCCCSQRDNRLERGADSVVLLSTVNNLLYPLTYYRPFNRNLPNWNSQLKEGKHFASCFRRKLYIIYLSSHPWVQFAVNHKYLVGQIISLQSLGLKGRTKLLFHFSMSLFVFLLSDCTGPSPALQQHQLFRSL